MLHTPLPYFTTHIQVPPSYCILHNSYSEPYLSFILLYLYSDLSLAVVPHNEFSESFFHTSPLILRPFFYIYVHTVQYSTVLVIFRPLSLLISPTHNPLSFSTSILRSPFRISLPPVGPLSLVLHWCTALLKAEFFIEPPPDTQRDGRRGERGTGVARGSYLSLTSLPSAPPPPRRVSVAPPAATLSGLAEGRPLPLPTAPPFPHGQNK